MDILAEYYAEQNDDENGLDRDFDRWFEYFSPLYQFGWPEDELPDFENVSFENVPQSVKPKIHRLDDPVQTRPRRTYLTVIEALCQKAGIDRKQRGAAQKIRKATEEIGSCVDDGTIQKMLMEIPDALESRLK